MKRPPDLRPAALALTLGAVLAGGWVLRTPAAAPAATVAPVGRVAPDRPPPAASAQAAAADELRLRFGEAVTLLNGGQFGPATTALHRVLQLAPAMPEAHVNLGFAMLGLGRPAMARESFERAMQLQPGQANAYYGLALALEAGGDIELALGAMRSYLHLAHPADERHLRKARAALWEWEAACRGSASASASGAAAPTAATGCSARAAGR